MQIKRYITTRAGRVCELNWTSWMEALGPGAPNWTEQSFQTTGAQRTELYWTEAKLVWALSEKILKVSQVNPSWGWKSSWTEWNELNWTEWRHCPQCPELKWTNFPKWCLGNWTILNWCQTSLNFEWEYLWSSWSLQGPIITSLNLTLIWFHVHLCHKSPSYQWSTPQKTS